MTRCENRQPACHRFQHGIGNAFLISVAASFARMQKNVRLIKKLAQFFLRNKTRKIDSRRELKFARERLEFGELRSFAGNRESHGWKFFPEFGERTQGCLTSLLFNQPSCLQQTPLAVVGNTSWPKWKISERDSGALDFDLLRSAAKVDHRLP